MSREFVALTEFSFNEKKIRVFGPRWDLWFVGSDVATALGYKRPMDAISWFVAEDDTVKQEITNAMGCAQETILINESGLYSVIFGSDMPDAKKFKCYVTHEVLPSIRRYGCYKASNPGPVPKMPQGKPANEWVMKTGEKLDKANLIYRAQMLGANNLAAQQYSGDMLRHFIEEQEQFFEMINNNRNLSEKDMLYLTSATDAEYYRRFIRDNENRTDQARFARIGRFFERQHRGHR